jgi:insertion element IS1 protein InsB
MELRRVKKTATWLWWAIDRTTRGVLGWALGDRDTGTARALGAQAPQSPHIRYHTDHWCCHESIFPKSQHIQSKAHTHIIESMNNKLRCYLARLRRKTHCYSKSAVNLRDSLLFIFQRKFGCKLVPSTTDIVCQRLWSESISIPV